MSRGRAPLNSPRSISSFASVADRQNHDLFTVVVIKGYVGALTELNQPLAKSRLHFLNGTAHLRLLAERFHTLPYRLDRTLCGSRILG